MPAGEIDRVARPRLSEDFDGLGGMLVALVVVEPVEQIGGEPFGKAAARNQVDPPAAPAHRIEPGADARDDQRVKPRGVERRDTTNPRGRGEQVHRQHRRQNDRVLHPGGARFRPVRPPRLGEEQIIEPDLLRRPRDLAVGFEIEQIRVARDDFGRHHVDAARIGIEQAETQAHGVFLHCGGRGLAGATPRVVPRGVPHRIDRIR